MAPCTDDGSLLVPAEAPSSSLDGDDLDVLLDVALGRRAFPSER